MVVNIQVQDTPQRSYYIAIVIVLYNEQPPSYIYQNQTCQIYLVDNTPERNLNISFDGITYIPLGANMGIAKALNVPIDTFAIDFEEDNSNIFLSTIRVDVENMSKKQLDMLRDSIETIKKYEF